MRNTTIVPFFPLAPRMRGRVVPAHASFSCPSCLLPIFPSIGWGGRRKQRRWLRCSCRVAAPPLRTVASTFLSHAYARTAPIPPPLMHMDRPLSPSTSSSSFGSSWRTGETAGVALRMRMPPPHTTPPCANAIPTGGSRLPSAAPLPFFSPVPPPHRSESDRRFALQSGNALSPPPPPPWMAEAGNGSASPCWSTIPPFVSISPASSHGPTAMAPSLPHFLASLPPMWRMSSLHRRCAAAAAALRIGCVPSSPLALSAARSFSTTHSKDGSFLGEKGKEGEAETGSAGDGTLPSIPATPRTPNPPAPPSVPARRGARRMPPSTAGGVKEDDDPLGRNPPPPLPPTTTHHVCLHLTTPPTLPHLQEKPCAPPSLGEVSRLLTPDAPLPSIPFFIETLTAGGGGDVVRHAAGPTTTVGGGEGPSGNDEDANAAERGGASRVGGHVGEASAVKIVLFPPPCGVHTSATITTTTTTMSGGGGADGRGEEESGGPSGSSTITSFASASSSDVVESAPVGVSGDASTTSPPAATTIHATADPPFTIQVTPSSLSSSTTTTTTIITSTSASSSCTSLHDHTGTEEKSNLPSNGIAQEGERPAHTCAEPSPSPSSSASFSFSTSTTTTPPPPDGPASTASHADGQAAADASPNTTTTTSTTPTTTTPPPGNPPKDTVDSIPIWRVVKLVWSYVWPKGDWKMKSLVVTSVMCVLVGKTLKVMVPFAFKGIVDALSVVSTAGAGAATATTSATAVAAVALPFSSAAFSLSVAGFLVAYGVSRVAGSFADELKNALFAPVGAAGTTNLGIQTMRKLHSLDLTYHLNREIGVLSKDLDRGSRAFWNFAYMLLFLITPTIFEMGLVGTALYTQGGGQFILIGAAAIAMYVVWTVSITNWRAKFRTRFNTYDSKVSGMVIDSLMNFETVKYFGAESYECDRIEKEMQKMNHQLKLLDQSVALLNMGQQVIFAAAAAGSLYLASCGVLAGTMTVGHLVLVDGLLIQLYMPLSYLGMIYRDVQTSTQNMQAMLSIMDAECDVKDSPNARPYAYKDGTIEFRNVSFEYMTVVHTPPKRGSSSTGTSSMPRRGDGAEEALSSSSSSSPLRSGKETRNAVETEKEVEKKKQKKKNESSEVEPTTTLSSSSSTSPPSTSQKEAVVTNEKRAEKESAKTFASTATTSGSDGEGGSEGVLQPPSLSVKKRLGVLHKVDFTIPGGSVVAFVGASGSGKSTIFRLLFRFFNPSNGTILLDGQPLQELQIQSVRQHIGVIPQDPILFNNSIKYNVSYSRSTPTSVEEVMRAAKGACLHDTVMGFPDGYFTGVGERGCRLSGGEKQRVAIARALLDDKPILLADEATSALDIETEKGVMEALKEQRGGSGGRRRTLLLIAHRLTTVKDADIIFVLRDGAVAEFGDHDALLKHNGIYSQLWLRQLEEKEVEESKEGKASSPTTS